MRLIYQGVDITDQARVIEAQTSDRAGGEADDLRLLCHPGGEWWAWAPKAGDAIEMNHGGYATGIMWVDSLTPDEKGFELRATSLPPGARERGWGAFEDIALLELLLRESQALSMGYEVHGLRENWRYRRLVRQDESIPAFLQRVLMLEGMTLKFANGTLHAIDERGYEAKEPVRIYEVPKHAPREYRLADHKRLGSLTVRGRGFSGTACVGSGPHRERCDQAVYTIAHAQRAAFALIRDNNKGCETLNLPLAQFEPELAAMSRVNLEGGALTAGKWLCAEVRHDLVKEATDLTLRRVLEGY